MIRTLPEQMHFALFSETLQQDDNMSKAQRRALRIDVKEPSYKREIPFVIQMLFLALASKKKNAINDEIIIDNFLDRMPFFLMPSIFSDFLNIGADASFYQWNVPYYKDGSQETSFVKFPDEETLARLTPENAWDVLQPFVATRLTNTPVPSAPNFRLFKRWNYENIHYLEILGRMRVEEYYAKFVQETLDTSESHHNHYVISHNGETFTRNGLSKQLDILNKLLAYYLGRMVKDNLEGGTYKRLWAMAIERLSEVYNSAVVDSFREQIFGKEGSLIELAMDPSRQVIQEILNITEKDFRLISGGYCLTQWKIGDFIFNMIHRLSNTF